MTDSRITLREAEPLLYLIACGGSANRVDLGRDFSRTEAVGEEAVAIARIATKRLAALGMVAYLPVRDGPRRAVIEITEKGRIAAALAMVQSEDLRTTYFDDSEVV